jgi:hypothetical protein
MISATSTSSFNIFDDNFQMDPSTEGKVFVKFFSLIISVIRAALIFSVLYDYGNACSKPIEKWLQYILIYDMLNILFMTLKIHELCKYYRHRPPPGSSNDPVDDFLLANSEDFMSPYLTDESSSNRARTRRLTGQIVHFLSQMNFV